MQALTMSRLLAAALLLIAAAPSSAAGLLDGEVHADAALPADGACSAPQGATSTGRHVYEYAYSSSIVVRDPPMAEAYYDAVWSYYDTYAVSGGQCRIQTQTCTLQVGDGSLFFATYERQDGYLEPIVRTGNYKGVPVPVEDLVCDRDWTFVHFVVPLTGWWVFGESDRGPPASILETVVREVCDPCPDPTLQVQQA